MDERERDELLDALLERLRAGGAGEGMRLADLMRLEKYLADGLAIVRREIDLIVRSLEAPPQES